MNQDKVVKAISLPRFEVQLIQLTNDKYVILYENKVFGEPEVSEMITDFTTANFLFNLKIEELEGN